MKRSDNIRCIREYTKKDGTKSYHAEVRRKNAKPLRDSFRTMTEAKNWVRKMESELLEGKSIPDNKARKHTLSDLIERYTNLHLSKFPGRLKDQKPHLNWWNEKYGYKLLIDITPSLLSEAKEILLNGITPRKHQRSHSTVNRYFATLSRAFTLAFQEWQWIHENPFRRVSKLKENSGRNRYLSEEELHTLLACCQKSTNRNLYGMVLIAVAMGLRFGEIANLRWKHIDFNRKLITLEMTKNGDRRVVPMPNQVSSYLSEIPGPKIPEKHVFPSKNSTNKSASLIRKAFQKAIKLADLQDFRFHDLRHTCASHLAMNGATQGELMEVLGHRSPVMTKRYAHFSKEHIAKILQKTNDNLINTPRGTTNGTD